MKTAKLTRRGFLKTSTAGLIISSTTAGQDQAQKSPSVASAGHSPTGSHWDFRPAEKVAIFRSDMSRCAPAGRLTRSLEKGRWQLIDYETAEGVKGVMASAYPDQACGELTLPLAAQGPHK